MNNSLTDRLSRSFEPASRKRLEEEMERFCIELYVLIETSQLKTSIYATSAADALASSWEALRNGKIQSGWSSLHEAQCLSVFLLNDERLKNEAEEILNEGREKLGDWRKETLTDLLCVAMTT